MEARRKQYKQRREVKDRTERAKKIKETQKQRQYDAFAQKRVLSEYQDKEKGLLATPVELLFSSHVHVVMSSILLLRIFNLLCLWLPHYFIFHPQLHFL